MKTPALALALLLLASPAFSQYIYLDSNGDGVHTSADVLHGVGPTVVEVWLDTAHNRDGTPAVCHTDAGPSPVPLNMFSYELGLQAIGGTVTFSGYANHVPQMGLIGAPQTDDTRFATTFFLAPGASLPPGLYHLGTLNVTSTAGAPSLHCAPSVFDFPLTRYTFFGSNCDGTVYANSIALGVDWFDEDGLSFDAGGMTNQPPSLSAFPDPHVLSGENLTQSLTAIDPEGQPLSFSKGSGPAYLSVTTIDPSAGTGHGELRLAPFASDIGTAAASVSVTDGTAVGSRAFTITVSPSAGHPPVLPDAPEFTTIAGRVGRRLLSGGDPDGATPHFRLVSGPPYASLHELASRSGGASASLRLSPGLCDVGAAVARVAISDGISEAQRDIALKIVPPTILPDAQVHFSPNPGGGFGIKLADMNGDGLLDAVVTYEGEARVSVLRGLGDGRFGPPSSYAIAASAFRLAVGDLDRNGSQDVVTASTNAGSLSVLLNRGDGTLTPAVTYPASGETQDVAIADLNRDGVPDLIGTNQAANSVSTLLGNGDGTFRPSHDSFAGLNPVFVAVADFNLDGRLDAAIGNQFSGASGLIATVLPGLGDGTFGEPVPTSANRSPKVFPLAVAAEDWNLDGLPDLAVADGNGPVLLLLGHGDGTFETPITVATLGFPYTCASGDLDGDGYPDLVVGDVDAGVVVLLGNGAGGFGPSTLVTGIFPIVALGDVNGDGRPDFVSASVGVRFNRFGPANPAIARAFLPSDKRSVPLSGNSDLVVLVEASDRSYTNDLLDLASFTLSSQGTGSVGQIHGISSKSTIAADRDGNGVSEVGIAFSRSDLAGLFDQLHGKQTLTADLAGSLTDGRAFCTDVSLTILGKAHSALAAASFSPNPLNPSSKLTFATEREGLARVMIFDIHGRLVRKLLDNPRLSEGPHEIVFDGKTDRGAALSSGVYFYRVETADGRNDGQIVILK